MDNIDLSPLMSSQPELYAIFLLVAYLGRKYWPLLKQKIEMQRAQLDGDLRREKLLQDILDCVVRQNAKLDTLASKDDVIYSLKERLETPILTSESIAKQAING